MARLTLIGVLIVTVLVALPPSASGAVEDPTRQKLVALFKSVQDVLLTINSEIIQYQDRFSEISKKLQDRALWDRPTLDEGELLPHVRGLNRLKLAVSLIGNGLETKYAQLKTFQVELRDKYPDLTMEIEYHYNLFDKVYEDSRERHRRLMRDMEELRTWFKSQVKARAKQKSSDGEEYSTRPFRKRRANRPSISSELGHPVSR